MKIGIRLFSNLLLSLLLNQCFAQKVLRPLQQNEWHVQSSDYATGNTYTKSAYRRNINYLPNGGVVIAANFNNDQCGAVRMDENGKNLWNLRVKGFTVGVGRMNSNFILFYSNLDMNGRGLHSAGIKRSSTVRAAIINGESGKLIKDILMYDNGEEVYIESKPLNRPDGSFSTLFVRVTDFSKGSFNVGKIVEKELASPKVVIAGLDDNLNVKKTEIKSKGQEGLFVGAELGPDDNLFFATVIDDALVVERFNKSGEMVKKLSTPLEVRTVWNSVESISCIDPQNLNSFFLALDYTKKNKDNMHQVFEFNFTSNKVTGTGEQELNKSYLKSFEVSEIKEIQNSSKFSGAEGFKLSNFLITADKIIIVKGYQSAPQINNNTRYNNEKVAIEIFDRDWHKLKGLILDRKFEAFEPVCRSIGANIVGGKLYIVLPALIGIGKVGTLFGQIDLASQKVEKYVLLDDPYLRRGLKGPVIESDASIWLKNGVLIENCGDETGILSSKENISSMWQKIEY